MPIGGSAYYDKIKKSSSPKVVTPAKVNTPVLVAVPLSTIKVKTKVLTKTLRPSVPLSTPVVRTAARKLSGSAPVSDPGALDEIVSQILDLAQRVHAVAAQAEAAVLRAEAAVLKAELSVGKAESVSLRAEALSTKSDIAASRAEAAVFKSEASCRRSEMFAGQAGMAAGKSELMSAGRDIPQIDLNSAGNKAAIREKPVSQIAVMSMKLRSGMRQIEESNDQIVERPLGFRPSAGFRTPVERDNLASGLVSLDNDTALPRVAPFIMDDFGYGQPRKHEVASTDTAEASEVKETRTEISSAA